ncbi:MAG: hypothetical protein V7K27_15380 [Nostoc sp.]|uniref:hypothetical protein n=1 Tax=Nostoc sp. TaxID=1180 RepID=UPI002FF5736B
MTLSLIIARAIALTQFQAGFIEQQYWRQSSEFSWVFCTKKRMNILTVSCPTFP